MTTRKNKKTTFFKILTLTLIIGGVFTGRAMAETIQPGFVKSGHTSHTEQSLEIINEFLHSMTDPDRDYPGEKEITEKVSQ